MLRSFRSSLRLAGLTLALLLLPAAGAHAAVASLSLSYSATDPSTVTVGSSAAVNITVTSSGGGTGFVLTANNSDTFGAGLNGQGCKGSGTGTLTCSALNPSIIVLGSSSFSSTIDATGYAPAAPGDTWSGYRLDVLGAGGSFSGGDASERVDFTGTSTLSMGAGDDIILGSGTAMTITGGTGTDLLDYSAKATTVSANLSTGVATGASSISGVESLTGGSAADTLTASASAGTLSGAGGNDTLTGKAGNDTLLGGAGNDTLNGGTGTDSFDGGDGDDTLQARDGVTETTLNCNLGTDSLDADTAERANQSGCETVTYEPDTTISSQPSGIVKPSAVSVSFSATPNAVSFQCRVDSGSWAACTSPYAPTLANGSHTISVRALSASETESTPAQTSSFTVDGTAPSASITSPGGGAFLASSSLTATYSASDTNLSIVERNLDGGGWVSVSGGSFALLSLSEGSHSLQLRATDAAGNTTTVTVTFTVDTIAPSASITSPAADGAFLASASPSLSYSASDATLSTVERNLDGGGWVSVSGGSFSLSSLSEGSHSVQLRATDSAGNATTVTRSFTVDTIAPSASITSPAADAFLASAAPSVSYSAGDANLSAVERKLDDGEWTAVSGGSFSLSGLSQGQHTIRVRATDSAGNTTTATRSFTVDTIDPSAAITSPAADAFLANASPSVSYSASDTNLTLVERKLDDGAWTTVTDGSFDLSGLSQGQHTVRVRATDAAGNTTTATRSFTVDTVAPSASITAPSADAFLANASPNVTYSATDTNLTLVERKLDDSAWVTVSDGSFDLSDLEDGQHTIRVRASDAAGNTTTATRSFTVDTIDPDAAISSPAADAFLDSAAPSVSYSASDTNLSAVERKLDDGEWTAVSGGAFDLSGLDEGQHTIRVRATDAAGNATTATRNFTVDTIDPEAAVTSPADDAFLANASPSVTYSASDTNLTLVERKLDDGAWSEVSGESFDLADLSEGEHTVRVRATDAAGNSTTTAARSFTVDTIDPEAAVTSPATDGLFLATASPELTYSASDTNLSAVERKLDDGDWTAASQGAIDLYFLSEGEHTLRVRATDSAGNTSTVTRSFTVDTIDPELTLQLDTNQLGFVNDSALNASYSASDTNLTLVERKLDDGAWSEVSAGAFNVADLDDGQHTIQVRATDAAGNHTTVSDTVTVDTIDPELDLTSPEEDQYLDSASLDASYSASDANLNLVERQLDEGSWGEVENGAFNLSGLEEGEHSLSVRATDKAGNTTTVTHTFTVDTIAPQLSITSPEDGQYLDSASPSASYSASDVNLTEVERQVDDGAWSAVTEGAFSLSGLQDGEHILRVRATDAAGNRTTTSVTVTVDTTHPEAAFSSGPEGLTSLSSPEFAFAASDTNLDSVSCRLDDGSFAACESPYQPGALENGAHTVQLRAIDLAGNATTATRAFTVRNLAPALSITGHPALMGTQTSGQVSFEVEDLDLDEVTCQLDEQDAETCESSFSFSGLADGPHTVTVVARDEAGNHSSHVVRFTVDTTDPELSVTEQPADTITRRSATVRFSVSDAHLHEVLCQLDEDDEEVCSSPVALSGLADGEHQLRITAHDEAGNSTRKTVIFTVDSDDPLVSITAHPAAFSASASAQVSFTITDADPDITDCRVDDGEFAPCESPYQLSDLADGEHSIEVRHTNHLSRQSSATISFVVDTTDPALNLTSKPSGLVGDRDQELQFTASDANFHGVRCQVDDGPDEDCEQSFTAYDLVDGPHTVTVTASDRAGNTSSDSASFTVDASDPSVSLSGLPAFSAAQTLTATVSASDAHLDQVQCRVDADAWSDCSAGSFELSGLSEGQYTVQVRATDQVGNLASDQVQLTIDRTNPTITPSSQLPQYSDSDELSIAFAASDAHLDQVRCRVDDSSWQDCASGEFTASGLAEGLHTLQVRARDRASNSLTIEQQSTVDTTDPQLGSFSLPAESFDADGQVTLTFTASDAYLYQVRCRVDEGSWQDCAAGSFSVSGLADGEHDLQVRARDRAGNATTVTRQVTVDSVAPKLTIADVSGDARLTTVTVRWTVDEDHPDQILCRRDGQAFSACAGDRVTLSGLAVGAHSFQLKGIDKAGNTEVVSAQWTTLAPSDDNGGGGGENPGDGGGGGGGENPGDGGGGGGGENPPPPADSDGDGVPDAQDRCPQLAGSAELGGCPAPGQSLLVAPAKKRLVARGGRIKLSFRCSAAQGCAAVNATLTSKTKLGASKLKLAVKLAALGPNASGSVTLRLSAAQLKALKKLKGKKLAVTLNGAGSPVKLTLLAG